MEKTLKILSILFTLLFTAIIMSSCRATGNSSKWNREPAALNTPSGNPVVIRFSWWGEKKRHEGTLAAIDAWNGKNTGVIVEPKFSGWNMYHEELDALFARKDAPDVFQFSTDYLRDYAQNRYLLELTPHMDEYFIGLDEGIRDSISIEGKIYGVPSGLNAKVLCYSKTRLNQLGITMVPGEETWDSLLEKCKEVTGDWDGDGKTDYWGIGDLIESPFDIMETYLLQNGVSLWKENLLESNFDHPGVLKALEKWEEFREAGVCPKPDEVTLKEGEEYIHAGYVAFAIISLSQFFDMQQSTDDELDIIPIPKTAGGVNLQTLETGLPMGIYNHTLHEKEALEFLSWFLTSPGAARASGMVRGIFPSKAQRDAAINTLNPGDRKLVDAIAVIEKFKEPSRQPLPVNFNAFYDLFVIERDRYVYGELTLEEFLRDVKKKSDPVLIDIY